MTVDTLIFGGFHQNNLTYAGVIISRDVVLESRTWTRVRLESRFLGLGLGLGLETCGLGLGLGLDTSGLETWT